MHSTRHQHRHDFRPKLIALSVAACFSLSATQAQANPTGGTVVSGSASFATSGNTLTITNSAGAIINWASFSIGVNEITQFLQSSSSSAVLNHVVGLNGVIPQSVIDGILSSNGRVFLLNQSGILIGSTGRIDVAGFVASSLNLSNEDFLAGRLNFTETPGAGAVTNAGIINTSAGGRVFLIAPDVQNSGIIRSPQGEIVLAAGKSVELVSEGSPFVTVNITADSERALNVGQLISESGHIGMFGALVRQGGVIDANSAVAGPGGEIRLVATRDLTLDAGSLTTANGSSGGNVLLQAQGGTNLIYGAVEATGSSGRGGTIQALGVRVGVLGSGVIDASGDAGGGTVLIGGDAHGANPSVQNAEQVLIGPDGVIRADAGTTGDGGRVIVWSDASTRAFGSISAQGGAQSGNGGFVETSSAGDLDVGGLRVDTRAANGRWGTWLLDPTNVIFEPNSYGTGDPLAYASSFAINPGTTAHITEATVENAFATNGTVQIQATNDVLFGTDLVLSYAGAPQLIGFEVRAQNNIDLAYAGGVHTIFAYGQNVTLSANDLGAAYGVPTLNTTSGTGSILGGGNIIAANGGVGGNIVLSGYGVSMGTLQTAGGPDLRAGTRGNILITALGGGVTTGDITTRGIDGTDLAGAAAPIAPTAGASGGTVSISSYGAVNTGNIDASGGRGGNGGIANGEIYGGAAGGSGGAIAITTYGAAPGSITTGTIASAGGVGGYGGGGATVSFSNNIVQVGYGGAGGAGGSLDLYGGIISVGNVNLAGAAGGAGGSNINATIYGTAGNGVAQATIDVGSGGNGGVGGLLIASGSSVSVGSITTAGGAGGAGGTGNSAIASVSATSVDTQAIAQATVGQGGFGGSGRLVQIISSGTVSVGTIDAAGAAGGAGGANSSGSATAYGLAYAQFVSADVFAGQGGNSGSGGQVIAQSTGGGAISTGAINVAGAAGAAGGGNSSASAYASTFFVGSFTNSTAYAGTGGSGGFGGPVDLYGGNIIVSGAITATGGTAGAGSSGDAAAASGYGTTLTVSYGAGTPGFGGFGSSVSVTGTSATLGSIDTSGAPPGNIFVTSTTGDISTGSLISRSLSPAFFGGFVSLQTDTGRILVNGDIDVRGASGLGVLVDSCGDGCIDFVYGGSGAGSVSITRTDTNGAPAGGTAIQVYGGILAYGGDGFSPQGAAGGAGGDGGIVTATTVYGTVIVAGIIDVHGGYGGAGSAGYAGGDGGLGGSVDLSGDSVTVGTINALGGAGGVGGVDDLVYGGGYGGYGGFGGVVVISSGPYGTSTIGSIFAAGGDGGAGGNAGSVLAGIGGDGGYGGGVFVGGGTVNVTGSVLDVHAGAAGAGGSGSSVIAGGNGGAGGSGGFAEFLADTQISVPAAFAADVAGGAGGAGGADLGAGAGIAGASGTIGQFITIPSLTTPPSSSGEPSESRLALNTLDESVGRADVREKLPPTVEEIEKKDKEKKEKKEAVCK